MLSFATPGTIDPTFIKTFGLSAKECENPIGQFGTGLKYAIAIIMARGGSVRLRTGGKTYEFGVADYEARGSTYKIVTMNGEHLPFTTHLGSTWPLWTAYRELYCNTIDEGGYVYLNQTHHPGDDWTVFEVEGLDAFYHEHNHYFLNETPIGSTHDVEFYEKPGRIFFRGVLVHEAKNMVMSYNIKAAVELTEDRTLKDPQAVMSWIIDQSQTSDCPEVITEMVLAPEYAREHNHYYTTYPKPSQTWLDTMEPLVARHRRSVQKSALRLYEKLTAKTLSDYPKANLSDYEKRVLQSAIDFVDKLVDEVPEVMVVDSLDASLLGTVDKGKIILSRQCLSQGKAKIAGTIFEEWAHINYGYQDCSRGFQDFLLDKMIHYAAETEGEIL